MTHLETIRRGIAVQLSRRGAPVSWRSVRVRAVPEPLRPGWWMLVTTAPVQGCFWHLGTRRRSRRFLLAVVARAFARRMAAVST